MRVAGAIAAALALTTAAAGQDGLAGVLRTIDGRSLRGMLVVADGRASVAGGGPPVVLDLGDVSSFDVDGMTAAPAEAPHRIWLRSGLDLPATRIAGEPAAAGQPARVVAVLPSGATLAVPLATVRALRQGGAGRPEPALFAADLAAPPANEDVLHVVKGERSQRSSVTVTGLSATRIEFLLRGESFDFELAGVAAVVFGANTGFAPDRQPKPRTRVTATTGEQFEGRLLALDATGVRCRLDEGVEVVLPAGRLLRLQVASDRVAWLSELTPRVEQTPAFDRVWPWTIDRTPVGPGFRLGGRAFERGIGMVPRTRLSYDLGGRFDAFEAWIGIDDRGGPEAHAVFRVFLDGELAFESVPKTRGLEAEPLRLDLRRAGVLAIEVDFGKNYDLGDLCAFADARVVQR